jgi:hypothetical protein
MKLIKIPALWQISFPFKLSTNPILWVFYRAVESYKRVMCPKYDLDAEFVLPCDALGSLSGGWWGDLYVRFSLDTGL